MYLTWHHQYTTCWLVSTEPADSRDSVEASEGNLSFLLTSASGFLLPSLSLVCLALMISGLLSTETVKQTAESDWNKPETKPTQRMRMLNSLKTYKETHFSVCLSVSAPSDSAETTEAQGQCVGCFIFNSGEGIFFKYQICQAEFKSNVSEMKPYRIHIEYFHLMEKHDQIRAEKFLYAETKFFLQKGGSLICWDAFTL